MSSSLLFKLLWWITGGNLFRNKKELLFPSADNHPCVDAVLFSRREVVKNLAVLPWVGFIFWDYARKQTAWKSYEEEQITVSLGGSVKSSRSELLLDQRSENLEGIMPRGKIGNLQISRMILGGNIASGNAHARDLVYVSRLMRAYNTDEKVIETLFLAEQCGINSFLARIDGHIAGIMRTYRQRGGKMHWLVQYYPDELDDLKWAIDEGADAVYAQGSRTDVFLTSNRMDIVEKAVNYAKDQGIPSGVAGHLLEVPVACEQAGLDADFYLKTVHDQRYWSAPPETNRDRLSPGFWSPRNDETIEFMQQVKKPWIAFKILAAGAIRPSEGLQYAFENGADFACVGMFDFQVVDNCNTVYRLFRQPVRRSRPWYS